MLKCDNFESGETRTKIQSCFYDSENAVFVVKTFLSYKKKSIIGGASLENILESEIDRNQKI